MAKQPLLPEEDSSKADQQALDKFYRENPDAMRKWVDTDASAFGAFPDADEEDAEDSDIDAGEDSDLEDDDSDLEDL